MGREEDRDKKRRHGKSDDHSSADSDEERTGHSRRRHKKDEKRTKKESSSSYRLGSEDDDDGSSRDEERRRRRKKHNRDSKDEEERRSKKERKSDEHHERKKKRKKRHRDDNDDESSGNKKDRKTSNHRKSAPPTPGKASLYPMGRAIGQPPDTLINPENDYFSFHQEFWVYLYREEGVCFNDLSSEEARKSFQRFARQYNAGKLEPPYYDKPPSFPQHVLDESKTTQHKLAFQTTETERKGLEQLQEGVRRLTQYSVFDESNQADEP